MTAMQGLEHLMTGVRLYPFQVNWLMGQVYLLQTDPAFYDRAAFLDQRAVGPGMKGSWCDVANVKAVAQQDAATGPGLIFHVGHCGSTLISRALGLTEGIFSLREPLPLRDLASLWAERDAPWSPKPEAEILGDMEWMRALWARTPAPNQTAVVKATSFCSLLAAPWLDRFPRDRALCLAMAPEIYIATVLGASGYVIDLIGGARPRMAGLAEATSATLAPVHRLSPGEVAAMTFAAEMVAMQRSAEVAGDRLLRFDFDRYLDAPDDSLQTIAAHFDRPIDAGTARTVLANPILGRYSKATDYPFSAAERQQRLQESRAANRDEIRKGMDWLSAFAASHTLLAEALQAFGYAEQSCLD